jgi:curved DNA-binding protein CbpA
MTDHYELLGVMPNASKDEIRAAYRTGIENADSAQRADLNRAWNVLSDPVQRQRYDDALAKGESGEEVGVPARRTTGARRGSESSVPEVVDAPDESAPTASNRRPTPPPTIPVPEGMVMADVKTRSLAMVFDVSVLLVIFLVVQFVGVALIENQYPKQTDRVDALIERVDEADEAKGDAEDAKDKADDQLSQARQDNDSVAEADAEEAVDRAEARVKDAETRHENLNDDLVEAQNELRPMYLLITAAVLILSLLYTVPMSARTGQTLGKRLRKVRLVRVDGSKAGFGPSLIHYGVPIVLALALSGFLGPLALVLGLGAVLWNIRDRNRQGVHDKLAKTFVVQA